MGFLNSVLFWDVLFLIAFVILTILFLKKKSKKVVAEGGMFLYKTKIGLKVIDKIAKKHPRLLRFLGYIIVFLGYILMIGMIALLAQFVYIFTKPELVKIIKIPPLAPLIPYLPKIFKINWLPNLYFTYWIIAIAVIAIVHEGFHGIYARLHNIKIKSTGFGFLGPLLAYPFVSKNKKKAITITAIITLICLFLGFFVLAFFAFIPIIVFLAFFVEQDDNDMQKKKIFPQLTVLGAGVFANILVGIIFYLIMVGFFFSFYAPAGAMINIYPTNQAFILDSNNLETGQETLILYGNNLTQVIIKNKSYFAYNFFLENIETLDSFPVFQDQPGIRNNILGDDPIAKTSITKVDDYEIHSFQELKNTIVENYNPGDEVNIEVKRNGGIVNYEIELGEDYENPGMPVIGVVFDGGVEGWRRVLYDVVEMNYLKDPSTYYAPKGDSQTIQFFFDLLWWLVLINISVALVNMLPVAIFDGGRFFYLSVLGLTKSEKIAKAAFKFVTILFLLILVLLMFLWAVNLGIL